MLLFWICTSPLRRVNLSLPAEENPVWNTARQSRQEQPRGWGVDAQGGNRQTEEAACFLFEQFQSTRFALFFWISVFQSLLKTAKTRWLTVFYYYYHYYLASPTDHTVQHVSDFPDIWTIFALSHEITSQVGVISCQQNCYSHRKKMFLFQI